MCDEYHNGGLEMIDIRVMQEAFLLQWVERLITTEDASCTPGTYGRECEHKCNCNVKDEICFVSTGGCPDGCPVGYYEEGCGKECPPKYHGIDCLKPCSNNCLDELCDRVSGVCDACAPGKRGPDTFCAEDCPAGSYGLDCTETCNKTCGGDGSCDGVNGTCSHDCDPGYLGEYCSEACPPSTYGLGCLQNCSKFCLSESEPAGQTGQNVCDHVTGKCPLGCVEGFIGDDCKVNKTALPQSDSSDPAPTIIGVLIGLLVVVIVVAVIVAAVVVTRRKRQKSPAKCQPDQDDGQSLGSMSDIVGITESDTKSIVVGAAQGDSLLGPSVSVARPNRIESEGDEKGPYYNTMPIQTTSMDISVGKFRDFMRSHNDEYFRKQFQQIPGINEEATTDVALSEENKHKNRYKNICPYDHSRVLLNADASKKEGDYINASFIEGYGNEEKFIASQGPSKVILNDFVRMLWEQEVDKVVMLTNLIEEGKCKCERYWPEDGEAEFGDIMITLARTQVFADYTIRKLKLTKEGQESRFLTQFHFTSWPDKGVPTTPWGLVDFEQRVATCPTDKAIVVHCSAGVGRTGTFIALCNVLKEAASTGHMNFFNTLSKLRRDRINMIQTSDQYIFLHKAAEVALVCVGTTVTANSIAERIKTLEATSSSGLTNMAKEFEAICDVCAEGEDAAVKVDEGESGDGVYNVYENSRSVTNKLKNRFSNVLPKDFYRPHLMHDTKNTEDYINAVLVPSFKKRDQQILTQLPLPTTVMDFWRLVRQFKVTLVVAFEVDAMATDSTVGDYFPSSEDNPLICEPLKIETKPAISGSHWEKRTMSVSDVKKRRLSLIPPAQRQEHQLTHLKCSSDSLNLQTLLSLLKEIRTLSSRTNGRIVYMCRNGATYSGLSCVLSLLLDRMDNDLCLTVPLVVGAIKAIRPQVIPTLDQYKTLYDVLKRYNDTTAVYCNVTDGQGFKPNLCSNSNPKPTNMTASSPPQPTSSNQSISDAASADMASTNPMSEDLNVYANTTSEI